MHVPQLPFSGGAQKITTSERARHFIQEQGKREWEKIKNEREAMEILAELPGIINQPTETFDEKKQQIGRGDDFNKIYIYDESKREGYFLTEGMWSRSVTLKNEMQDLGWPADLNISSPIHVYPYSSDVMALMYDIFKACEDTPEHLWSGLVWNAIRYSNFQIIVSTLRFAHFLDVDKKIITELIKKIQPTMASLLSGKTISAQDLQALDEMNEDLRKEVLGVQWDIFLEKFKLSAVKRCSRIIQDNVKSYTYGKSEDAVSAVSFSPTGEYLFIDSFFRTAFILDVNDMKEVGKYSHTVHGWIEYNKFFLASYINKKLSIFECDEKAITEKKETSLNQDVFFFDNSILIYQSELIF
jgi:hypothetical protein